MKKMDNNYVYFLSLNKLEEDFKGIDNVPSELIEHIGKPVKPDVSVEIGVIGEEILHLDWCDKVSAERLSDIYRASIEADFTNPDLYTPACEILMGQLVETHEAIEELVIDNTNLMKGLGHVLTIIKHTNGKLEKQDMAIISASMDALYDALAQE